MNNQIGREDKIEVDYDANNHQCTVISSSRDHGLKYATEWMIQSVIVVNSIKSISKKVKRYNAQRLKSRVEPNYRINPERVLSPLKPGRRSAFGGTRSSPCNNATSMRNSHIKKFRHYHEGKSKLSSFNEYLPRARRSRVFPSRSGLYDKERGIRTSTISKRHRINDAIELDNISFISDIDGRSQTSNNFSPIDKSLSNSSSYFSSKPLEDDMYK